MTQYKRIGIDTSKAVFTLRGIDQHDRPGLCAAPLSRGRRVLRLPAGRSAEHLATRSNSVSFADMRNIVCLCRHHHGHFTPEHSRLYWELIHRHIGPERLAWLGHVEQNKRRYRFYLAGWKGIEAALKAELSALRT